MSGSASITRRMTKSGPRWDVRFRLGGRDSKVMRGGTFTSEKRARARRDFILGELAAGRNPALSLADVMAPPAHRTLTEWAEAFIQTRTDVTEKTIRLYRHAKARIEAKLGDRDPHTLTVADVQEWISAQTDLAPSSLHLYASTFAQILDHAEVEPNPARSKRLRYPRADQAEVTPPLRDEFDRMLAKVRRDYQLPFRVKEATAMRIGELCRLTWGDIDFATGRFRISKARTKGRTGGQRWLPVPPELLDEISDLLPLEDRARDRRVFPKLLEDTARKAITNACKLAGVVDRHPHELRHRRISLWFAMGLDPVQIKTWAGHRKASMSLDVYAHVVVDVAADPWREFWLEAAQARGRVPSVEHEEADQR